jgi:hypothetical protein
MFIDVQCKCGKKFGWCGDMTTRPPCPKCGLRPPQTELVAAQQRMDEDRRLMDSRPEAAVCSKQRRLAGLTLRQAAKLLGVFPSHLSDVENRREALGAGLAERMIEVYGLDAPPCKE